MYVHVITMVVDYAPQLFGANVCTRYLEIEIMQPSNEMPFIIR